MRYKFYREHKYVSVALNDLERLIAKTDFKDFSQVKKVEEEFDTLIQMLNGHAHYEDKTLHKLLQEKASLVYKHIEEDHKHMDKTIADLQSLLKKVKEAIQEEEHIELGYQFYLWYRKFVGDNLIHLHEEETIILPELQRLYADTELREVEFDTYRRMSVEQMIHMLQILFPHTNPTDHEAFLKDIKDAVPEKFIQVWQGIQSLIIPQERMQLIKKLEIA